MVDRQTRTRRWFARALLFLGLGAIVIVLLLAWTSHRRPPTPLGMVLRIEAREVITPFDVIGVCAIDRDGPAVAIYAPDTTYPIVAPQSRQFTARLDLVRYPEGTLLESRAGDEAQELWVRLSGEFGTTDHELDFDFDGDGIVDHLTEGARGVRISPEDPAPVNRARSGVVCVRSGQDRSVLFEDHDPLEYENSDRAVPLGDLDGDGCSELALIHPRMDRSKYDWEFGDLFFGARSWVTVVSGARAAR